MNKSIAMTAGILLVAGCFGCQRKNEAKERIKAEREKWESSLPDSLKAIERQTDSLRLEIDNLNSRFDSMVDAFKYIDNPREVEGYYIAKAWAQGYPLKSTGLVARLTKSEKLELIAALAGGAHFDRLRVLAPGGSAETSTVRHDQALNYRMANLNTVCFSDSASDSCARLIAENAGSDIKIIFLEGDRQTGTITYPAASRKEMQSTWELYEVRRQTVRDERMIPLLARKAAIINRKIEEER